MGDPHQVDGGLVNGVELSFPDVGDGEEIEPCLLAGRGELPRHGVDRRIAVDPLPTAFVDRTFGPKFKREVPVGQELLLSLQLIVLVVENSDSIAPQLMCTLLSRSHRCPPPESGFWREA